MDGDTWIDRHRATVRVLRLVGLLVAVFAIVAIGDPLGSHGPGIAIVFAAAVAFGLPRLVVSFNRRRVRTYIDDPNVLWAGVAMLDRLDLLRAQVEPVAPSGYGTRATAALLTRTGLNFKPIKDRWGWQGLTVPYGLITQVTLGHCSFGNRRVPELKVLARGNAISLPLTSGDRGLAAAIAQSAIAARLVSGPQFAEAELDAELREEDGSPPAEDPASTDDAYEVDPDRIMQSADRRFRRSMLLLGVLSTLLVLGMAAVVVGSVNTWDTLSAAGLLASLGALMALGVLQIHYQNRARRARTELMARLDEERALRRPGIV